MPGHHKTVKTTADKTLTLFTAYFGVLVLRFSAL